MKKLFAGFLALGMLFALPGCLDLGTEGVGGEGEAEVITIGGIAPLTGDGASYGIEWQRIAEMSLEDVNTAWAEEGMELDIQWEDGACNGKDASTAAQKLVDVDKVELIVGGFCSSESLAIAPITDPAGVLILSPASSSPDLTEAGDYVFRDWPSDSFQGVKLAEAAYNMGYTKVALITEQQDYNVGISGTFTAKFEELGGTVVEETYLTEDSDFKTQLTKLQNESPDTYFVNAQTSVKGDIILKQMQELGIEGPFLLIDATAGTETLTTFSEFLEGSYTATVNVNEEDEAVVDLIARYTESYGSAPQYLSYDAATYDAVQLLAQAIMEEGNDAEDIKEYLYSITYEGLMGTIQFDENGDLITGHSLFKIENGQMVLQ